MSKEIIEQLKSNRVPYYLWTPEEREVADRIPRRWWLCSIAYLPDFDPVSTRLEEELGAGGGADGAIYRLRPDYEPESEGGWVETEITASGTSYDVRIPGFGIAGLHMAQSFVGYGGIMYEDCACGHLFSDTGRDGPNFSVFPIEPCPKHGPHKPVLVRFWRQKA